MTTGIKNSCKKKTTLFTISRQ